MTTYTLPAVALLLDQVDQALVNCISSIMSPNIQGQTHREPFLPGICIHRFLDPSVRLPVVGPDNMQPAAPRGFPNLGTGTFLSTQDSRKMLSHRKHRDYCQQLSETRVSVKRHHLLRPATLRGQPGKFHALLQN